MEKKTLQEVLDWMRDQIPVNRKEVPYKEILEKKFSEYQNLLKQIDNNELKQLGINQNKKQLVNFVDKTSKTILSVIDEYYKGFHTDAFDILYNLLAQNKFYIDSKIIHNRYISGKFGNHFLWCVQQDLSSMYRMRKSKEVLKDKEELFHIPFQLREKVSMERFSALGHPCLYLCSSLKLCVKEIGGCNETEKYYASRILTSKHLSLCDLTSCKLNTKKNGMCKIFRFLITYPFYIACLVKVEKPDLPFKPEYIIPNLLLLYVIKSDLSSNNKNKLNSLDGIAYMSTKEDANTEDYNIVLPTRKISDTGHCSQLKNNLKISDVLECDKIDISKCEDELTTKSTTILK